MATIDKRYGLPKPAEIGVSSSPSDLASSMSLLRIPAWIRSPRGRGG
eukprot:CAMPEP_0114681098 /NCGR_PEP_ID=MMETSP0191-20121206/54986_1 /TAXON_ID=126664 /ORGANISM="Sorites sp." /LENGTH=46 /DNA_ID= /DNA_START= /DNA_END= /DNA_ORIENTATION=